MLHRSRSYIGRIPVSEAGEDGSIPSREATLPAHATRSRHRPFERREDLPRTLHVQPGAWRSSSPPPSFLRRSSALSRSHSHPASSCSGSTLYVVETVTGSMPVRLQPGGPFHARLAQWQSACFVNRTPRFDSVNEHHREGGEQSLIRPTSRWPDPDPASLPPTFPCSNGSCIPERSRTRRCSSTAEQQPSKLKMRFRLPPPTPGCIAH
jgi:hypothetical protein